jgi:hypothetical protein
MDELFDYELPGRDWIAANHACVCNLDEDSWAPRDWKAPNCAYTGLKRGSPPTPVPNPESASGKRTHTLLNSGMFIFTPYEAQWNDMLKFLHLNIRVKDFLFPDQDFLAEYFRGRWKSVGWQFNALKTMQYWHENMWEDGEVKNLFLSDNAGLVVCVNRGLALGCSIFLGIRHVEVDPRFSIYKRG